MENTKKCKYCQSEIDKKAKICPNCKKKQNSALPKLVFVLVCIAIILYAFVNTGNDDSKKSANNNQEQLANQSTEGESKSTKEEEITSLSDEQSEIIGEGDIGKYYVIIKDIEITEDYAGKPAVIVTYEWTNNSDESKSFGYVLVDKVYQDGIECESSIIKIVTDDSGGKYKEIKPGKTLEFRYGYILNDTETDIEVEVGPWLSLSKNPDIVTKIFEYPK